MKSQESSKMYFRPFLMGSVIVTVLVLHFFVSQFISFEAVEDSSLSDLIERQPVKTQPKNEAPKAEISVKPETVVLNETAFPQEKVQEKAAPKAEVEQKIEKESVKGKRSLRESRAERLRRAEKILTGV